MARHEHRSVDHHHCSHNHNHNRRHHQRGRSLSPIRYQQEQERARSTSPHHHHHQQQQQLQHHSQRYHDSHHIHPPHHHRFRSPSPRHRSSPVLPHRGEERRRHYRKKSQSPHRGRSRRPYNRNSRGDHSSRADSRRHQSCGSLVIYGNRSSSLSPPPRRRASSKGSLAHHILKLLSTSARPDDHYKEEAEHRRRSGIKRHESIYNSWSHRVPRRRRSPADAQPLIPSDDETNVTAMPRRSSHHASHLPRARDEAAEAERLRKIREDVVEAERLRAEETAQIARRTRLQQELDEAEMRRVRALEQFNEVERQRREMQIEDRLRQLEDQDIVALETEKKNPTSKKCCKIFKIVFGVALSLGLVFVFYLIVASIMGTSSPLDIFNFDISNDPLLKEINNITDLENEKFPEVMTKEIEIETVYVEKNQTTEPPDKKLDYDLFESVVEHPYDSNVESSDATLEYVDALPDDRENMNDGSYDTHELHPPYSDDMSVGTGDHQRRSFETYEIQPPYDSNNEHMVYYSSSEQDNDYPLMYSDADQQLAPSIRMDSSFVPSNEDHYADNNFPQINKSPNRFVHRPVPPSSLAPSFFRTTNLPPSREYTYNEDINRSDVGVHRHLLPPVRISNRRLPSEPYGNRAVPTRGTVMSWDSVSDAPAGTPRRKQSLENLEKEIIDTLLEIADQEKMKNNRRMMVRTGYLNRPPRNQRPILRRMIPKNTRRRTTRTSDVGRSSPMTTPPQKRRPILRQLSRNSRPVRPIGRPLIPSLKQPTIDEPLVSQENVRRDRYDSRRPRKSNFHVPPPEFRYPKSAGSIQDIIDHMNDGSRDERQSFSRTQKETPDGKYVIGDQDHVLHPTFIKSGSYSVENEHKQRSFRGRGSKKTKQKIRRYVRPKYEIGGEKLKHPGEIHKYQKHVDEDDDIVFHNDGSVSHISNEHPPLTYPPPRSPPRKKASRSASRSQGGARKYKPFKVMLDVYPVADPAVEDYKPKYESRFTIEEEEDEDFYIRDEIQSESLDEITIPSVSLDEFFGPNSGYSPTTNYSPPESRNVQRVKYRPGPPYNSRERYTSPERPVSTKTLFRPRDRYTHDPRPRSRDKIPKIRTEPPYYTESEPHYSSPEVHFEEDFDPAPRVVSDGKKHTITLHINLFAKKPTAGHSYRRMDNSHREVGLDIPLTDRFSALDVYKALTRHVRRDSPYAQSLVSNREGKKTGSSAVSNDVNLFDMEEGAALLGALESALDKLNPALPETVQFKLPSSADKTDPASNEEALKKIVETGNVDDVDYTDGFVANVVGDSMDESVGVEEATQLVNSEGDVVAKLKLDDSFSTTSKFPTEGADSGVTSSFHGAGVVSSNT